MRELAHTLLVEPILNTLAGLYQLTGNLGISIILLTLIIRFILIPTLIPSMRQMKKQRELQPELDKIKEKYKNNKKKQAEAQMELFKEHGLNPASGCISQIPMFIVIFALYQAITLISRTENVMTLNPELYFDFVKFTTETLNTKFLWFDLTRPEGFPYILALLVGAFQFLTSKLTLGFTKKAEKIAKQTPDKTDDIAYNMQEQMLYIMPVISVVISISLPAGVVLYFLTTTLFSLAQTYLVLGKKNEKKAKVNAGN